MTLLTPADAPALAALLARQRVEYLAHFHPFDFTAASLAAVLAAAKNDRFWRIEHNDQLAGFFMLRGFDDGYTRPAFGVFVAEEFAGRGLARAALAAAISWCRENSIARIMLKVSADNPTARRVYVEAGFQPTGTCEKTGHEVMELVLRPSSFDGCI